MTTDKGRPTFGVDLSEQMARDDVDVPPIVVKLCEAIERYGLDSQGVYRIGGTVSKVQKLKERLDRGRYFFVQCLCGVHAGELTIHRRDRSRLCQPGCGGVVVRYQQRDERAQALATRATRPTIY